MTKNEPIERKTLNNDKLLCEKESKSTLIFAKIIIAAYEKVPYIHKSPNLPLRGSGVLLKVMKEIKNTRAD